MKKKQSIEAIENELKAITPQAKAPTPQGTQSRRERDFSDPEIYTNLDKYPWQEDELVGWGHDVPLEKRIELALAVRQMMHISTAGTQ